MTGLRIKHPAHPVGRGRPRPLRPRVGSRVLLAALCVLAATAAFAPWAVAQEEKSWYIDSIDTVLEVQDNGDVIVDETYTYSFTGSFSYVVYEIPSSNYDGITELEVRDWSGAALPTGSEPGTYAVEKDGDTYYVYLSLAVADASVTYTFHYRALGAVHFGDNDDQVEYEPVNGATEANIGRLRTTVVLPGAIPSDELLYEFEAGYGIEAEAYSSGPSVVVFEAEDVLAYSYFWTRTGFPKGVVTYHWTVKRVVEFITPIIGFALIPFTLLTVLVIWSRRGRDEPVQTYAKYVSEPPSDLSPGLAGALIDERVDTKEVVATIVDLARRGYLEMTAGGGENGLGKTDTIFTRLKSLDDLHGFEKLVANALFKDNHPDQVTTKDLKNNFYVSVPVIVDRVYEEVTSGGYFKKNPKRARAAWKVYGFVLGGLGVASGFVGHWLDIAGYGYFVAGLLIGAVIVWFFGRHMPARTAKGAREQKKWEAFRNYLDDLERFQDMEAAKEKFETCLPYAIALGVEKEWTRRFEAMNVPPPDWYHPPVIVQGGGPGRLPTGGLGGAPGKGVSLPSGGGFSLGDVSDGLFGALGRVSSVLTASPSKSGSSGRGAWGGGFSGGGFGGGGFSGGGFGGGIGGGGMRAG